MPKKIPIDLTKVEQLAARGLSQAKAAEELGIEVGTFLSKLQRDEVLKSAWKRGRAMHEQSRNGQASALTREIQLTANEEAVLAEIESRGTLFNDIVMMSRLDSNSAAIALRALQSKGLVRFEHPKYYLVQETETEEAAAVELEIVGSARTENAVARLEKPKRANTALVKRKPKAHTAISVEVKPKPSEIQSYPPPAINVQPVVPQAVRHALEGAAIELGFMSFHGVPSNKHEDVMTELAQAIRQ